MIGKPKPVLYDIVGIHLKLCCLASEKYRSGPKIVSEAMLKPLNSKKFLGGGGGMPARPPSCSVLANTLTTLPLQT